MANRIQTKITDFNFPNTIAKLKKDPNLYDGTVLLHDFSHPSGITKTAGFDVHQLKRSESQYVKFANSLTIAEDQDFEISCTFYANSMDNNMTLFGWDYNLGTQLTLEPSAGTYGRIKLRMAGPNAYFVQTDEPLRAGEIHRITVKRVSNVLTCEIDEQTFDMDPELTNEDDRDNEISFDYIGGARETPTSGQGDYLEQFFDGFIWDVKFSLGAQVGDDAAYTIDMPGTGDNPWVNAGTGGNTYDGSTFSGPDVNDSPGYAATAVTLTRKTIGTDAIANETTIQNIASEEAGALGATDTGIELIPSVYSDKLALSAGRGFKISNAWDTSVIGTTNTDYRLNKSVSDALIAANSAGRNVALSFWFKPNLDTFDSTNIGYFFRWGSNTSAGNYNYWILFNGAGTANTINVKPGGNITYDSTYTSVNSGVVNVIVTTSGGTYVNGTNISTTTTSTLQSYNTNEFSQEFMFSTAQHSSDRNIAYIYRLNFADIDTSGVTEAQWIAKEYDTGVKYIKAITDSTT